MKDSIKFLILTILGILCYVGYIILICFRGPALSDFIAISINMFIWLAVALLPDYLKLKRAEKEEENRNHIQQIEDCEIGYPQVNEYEIVIDDKED